MIARDREALSNATLEPGRTAGLRTHWWLLVLAICTGVLVHQLNRVQLRSDRRLHVGRSRAVGGDETHYLVGIHALLFDQSFDPTRAYARAMRGGPEAGQAWSGAALDHHAYVVMPAPGRTAYWSDVYDPERPTCPAPACDTFTLRDPARLPPPGSHEAMSHPPGFPLLAAALLWPWRPPPASVERAVSLVQQVLATSGIVLSAVVTLALGGRRRTALLAAGLLCASTWLPYSRSYFTELASGTLLLSAFALQLKACHRTSAGLVGMAGFVKPVFFFVGYAWALQDWVEGKRASAVQTFAVVSTALLAFVAFSRLVARRWMISGAGPWIWAHGLDTARALFFSSRYGILVFVPWVALPLAAIAASVRSRRSDPALRTAGAALLGYLPFIVFSAFVGASCYGPRFWVPFLPILAVCAARLFDSSPGPVRVGLMSAALWSLVLAVLGALQYGVLWDQPFTSAWRS